MFDCLCVLCVLCGKKLFGFGFSYRAQNLQKPMSHP